MTVAGMLTPDSGTAGYTPAPVISTAGETAGATFDFMRTNMNVDAALRLNNESFRARDDLIRSRFGQDPMAITKAMEKYPSRDPEAIPVMLQYHQEQIDQWITKGRQDDPKKFEGLKLKSEVVEDARNKARMSKQKFEDIQARNPHGLSRTIASLAGGIAGGFTDPLNVATLPFGAGAARTILGAAVIEGTLNAGVEVLSQPAVSAWQKELGFKYGMAEAAENVGLAFAGGAGLAAVIRGAVPAFKATSDSLGSFSSYALDKIASSEKLPATVRDAAAYMSRAAHIDESAPPGSIKDELDLVRHRETVARTANDLEQYRGPTSIQESPTAASSLGESREPVNSTSATDDPFDQDLPSQTSDTIPPSAFGRTRAMTPPSSRTGEVLTSSVMGTPTPKLYHKVDNPATIKAIAAELAPKLKEFLDNVTDQIKEAKVFGVRVKEEGSLSVKAASGRSAQNISDYVGGRIVVDSPHAMDWIVRRLQEQGNIIEVDDFLGGQKPSGYRAVHVQVMSDKGVSAEIQIQPREIRAVQDEAHKLYKEWQGKEITAENQKEYDAAKAKQKKLFDDAWKKWEERTGGDQATVKSSDASDTAAAENVKPPLRPEEVKAADRIASKQATFAQILKDDPDLKIRLEDGTVKTLKEINEDVKGDLAVIEALTSCRVA